MLRYDLLLTPSIQEKLDNVQALLDNISSVSAAKIFVRFKATYSHIRIATHTLFWHGRNHGDRVFSIAEFPLNLLTLLSFPGGIEHCRSCLVA